MNYHEVYPISKIYQFHFKWQRVVLFVFVLGLNFNSIASKTIVYFIPGQGADPRQFKNIELDSIYEIRYIKYFTPEKNMNMQDYARELAKQIDTTQTFSLVGVSLGGMLATEMNEFLNPEEVILISSAKCRSELPFRYRFQKKVPIYKAVPKGVVKLGAKILQPVVEPDRRHDKETFKAMLNDKDAAFMKRTVKMIMEWDRTEYDPKIIHIHGDNDHTLPGRNIKYDYLIEGGSHMMVLTEGKVISTLLNNLLYTP